MSKFSEYLEQGIIKSGLTEMQLSKISGFTRSYIALMKNGQRVSPDVERMEKLMQALNLSISEYEILKSEYIRMRIGNNTYERTKEIVDIVHSFNNVSSLKITGYCRYEIPEQKIIDNKMDLDYLTCAVIENEAEKTDGYVHLIMQGKETIVSRILPGVCNKNKKLKIEHLVCMEKYTDTGMEDNLLYNVKVLKEIIPVKVFGNSTNYEVYYYYDHVATGAHSGLLFPYALITSEYVLCINAELNRGILTKDEEIRCLYEEMFQKHKRKCKSMFYYMKNTELLLMHTLTIADRECVTYTLAQQPGFHYIYISGILRKYFRDDLKEQYLIYDDWARNNEQWMSEEKNCHISYCTKEGLLRFAQTGIIDELSGIMKEPLRPMDRKRVLEFLLEKICNGSCEIYLLDTEMIHIPDALSINSYNTLEVVLTYLSEDFSSAVVIKESSFAHIFYEVMRNMVKHPLVLLNENVQSYIQEVIKSIEI